MTDDPDLITDRMLGFIVVVGADLIILAGFAWLASFISTTAFVGITAVTVGSFAAWIGYRWRLIHHGTPESAVDTLKQRYAAGEIDEATFEAQLDKLIESEESSTGDEQAAESNPTTDHARNDSS